MQASFAQSLGMERPPRASGKKVIAGVATARVEDMRLLEELAEGGELRPVIDRSYPLESAAEAHADVDKGRKRGNVVLTLEHAGGPRRVEVCSDLATLGRSIDNVLGAKTADDVFT